MFMFFVKYGDVLASTGGLCAVGGRVRPLGKSVKTIKNLTTANDYSFAMARVA